jgi:ATP-dependent helicase HrpB
LLGAVDEQGLTQLGRRMLRFPLHPRLARVVLQAEAGGESERGCALCALLAERDIVLESRARFGTHARDVQAGPSDALDRLERFEEAEAAGFDAASLRAQGLDPFAVRAVAHTRDRLLRICNRDQPASESDEALLAAILAGFGDRVAKRRVKAGSELVLARGGSVQQSETSVVRDAELCVVLDASERSTRVIAHMLSAIEPEWLLELFPARVRDQTEVRFVKESERVEAVQTLYYDTLVLDQSNAREASGPDAERVLYEAALVRGADAFDEPGALEAFERRAAHAARVGHTVPALPSDAREHALATACEGKHSFSDLRRTGVLPYLRALLSNKQLADMERLAPDAIALPAGRRLRVHYEADRPPWVESRLQDFFGLQEGPKLGDQPLVLHLLAPNQRAVQVTTDLAGFWQRHYPELRRQLMRRYPRHAWPEDPRTARPPSPKAR